MIAPIAPRAPKRGIQDRWDRDGARPAALAVGPAEMNHTLPYSVDAAPDGGPGNTPSTHHEPIVAIQASRRRVHSKVTRGSLLLTFVLVAGAAACRDGQRQAAPAPSPSPAAPSITAAAGAQDGGPSIVEYAVPDGSHPHDVAPAADGSVWYTAQATGELGLLHALTGATEHISLGSGSAPHGVIVGPDGAPWITDAGLNAIVRVDPQTHEVRPYPLPADRQNANLNTAAFDSRGWLWFTGQSGTYGRLDPTTGDMAVFDAPRGRGPYGITSTPAGEIYFASLAGSYLGDVDEETGAVTVLEPPTRDAGPRRAWSDADGRVWVSEWNSGKLARYDPADGTWSEWRLPGQSPQAYAVYVDWRGQVWTSDFGGNTLVRFDPATEEFESFALPAQPGNVRQILGREGEVWAAESAADRLIVLRYD